MNGMKGIFNSKKAMMCLIILAVTGGVAIHLKDLPAPFAAVVASIVSIYCFTVHKIDIAALNKGDK